MTHRKATIAIMIMQMTYGELTEFCAELSSMIEPDVRPKIKTQDELAPLLYDWAEATSSEETVQ